MSTEIRFNVQGHPVVKAVVLEIPVDVEDLVELPIGSRLDDVHLVAKTMDIR